MLGSFKTASKISPPNNSKKPTAYRATHRTAMPPLAGRCACTADLYQLEERQKQRQLQRTWFLEHSVKQYDRVRNWVVESVQAINLHANMIWLSQNQDTKANQEQLRDQNHAYEMLRQRVAVESVKILAIAHSDVKLARRLDSFAGWLNRPGLSMNWNDDASLVLNRIYEIMGELPQLEANNSKEYDAAEEKLRQAQMKRRMLWYSIFIIVLVSVAAWWFLMYWRETTFSTLR